MDGQSKRFTILTANLRGIVTPQKRLAAFSLLASKNAQIYLITETHFETAVQAKKAEEDWKNAGGCGGFFSHSNRMNSGGVAILFGKNCHKWLNSAKNTKISVPGHMISTEIEIGVETHKIICVYGPKSSRRKEFFKQLTLKEKTKHKVILAGDFNFVENPGMDRSGAEASQHTTGANECRIFTENHRLIDAFRTEFPSKKAYTFTSSNQPITQTSSRLDRIYIPENASNFHSKIEEGRYSFTDHQMVTTSFSPEETKAGKRGRPLWKHDASLLEDTRYVEETNSTIDDYLNYEGDFDNIIDFWESLKGQLSEQAKLFSKKKQQQDKAVLKAAYNNLENEHNKPDPNPTVIDTLQQGINRLLNTKLDKLLIKTKLDKIEKDELPTPYFYRRLKTRAQKSNIEHLIDSKGNSFKDPKQILEQGAKFYDKLYHLEPEKIDPNIQAELIANISTQISTPTKEACERELTIADLAEALKRMPDGKSPGQDGFSAEFHKKFQAKLLPILQKVARECRRRQQMSDTQRNAILALLYKNKGEKTDLNNWRPISLLCVDYKIITKALSHKIQGALAEVIDVSQTAGIKNRSINNNLWLLRDMIQHANENKNATVMISLDQYKAFDMVNHSLMFKVLEKFGFGPNFIGWVKTLYTNCTSTIQNNGFYSRTITLERGVRQGCSLSCYLYVLVAELMAIAVRKDTQIKGYQLPYPAMEQIKISQYADDTLIFLEFKLDGPLSFRSNKTNLERIYSILKKFQQATGAVLNVGKSKMRVFGANGLRTGTKLYSNRLAAEDVLRLVKQLKDQISSDGQTLEVKPLDDGLEVLGINFFTNLKDTWNFNIKKLKAKIEKSVCALYGRNLTIRGRAIALNTLTLSKLWYIGSVLPVSTATGGALDFDTENLVDSIEKTCFDYLWQGRTNHPISKETIWLPVRKGGLGVLNIKWQCLSLKIKQMNQATDPNNTLPSSRFARYWLYKLNHTTQGRQNFQNHTSFLSDCEPGLVPDITRQKNLVFEACMDLAKGSITDFKKLFSDPSKPPSCKKTYQTLAYPKEVLNKKWTRIGINTHFNNSWKNFCGNYVNQYFWKMKHFALHIEGAIDSQSGNLGHTPSATRCTFCSTSAGLSHDPRLFPGFTPALNTLTSTATATGNTNIDVTNTDHQINIPIPITSLSDTSSDEESDEPTAPQLQLNTQTNTHLSDSDTTDDETTTAQTIRSIRQVVTNNTNSRSQIPHDSCEHTFIQCKRAEEVWEKVIPLIKKTKYILRNQSPHLTIPSVILGYPLSKKTVVINSLISATIYSIWQARIKLKWDNKFVPPFAIARKAIAIARDAITSHFEIAKRKSNEDLNIFKLKFEEPLLFTIDITNKKIEFKF